MVTREETRAQIASRPGHVMGDDCSANGSKHPRRLPDSG